MHSAHHSPKLCSALLALSVLAGSATASAAGLSAQKETPAVFSSFSYTGNDSYYNANPLTSDDEFFNPILPGWYSDPSVCGNGKGDYFLVTSTFTFVPGVPIFHSRDLVNWKQIGHVLTRPSQMKNFEHQHVSGGIFAPAISYCPANKTYYMITTNVGAGNFFVKTTDPFGEWSDPIYLPEVQGIDPAFFFDDNGKAYIVNNDDAPDAKPEYPGHRTVRVVEFDINTDKCVGERKIVVNKGCRPEEKPIWCEGPHIYKVNGEYYLMTAEGGTSWNHSEVIYRGPSPFGPYTPWEGNPILTQRDLPGDRSNPITCAGHADLVQTTEGDWWAVFLACRPVADGVENLGRETFLLPVQWTYGGWPVITHKGDEIPMKMKRSGVVRGENVTFGNFSITDDFSAPELGMEWCTLRGDANQYYSLAENPGNLTLRCAPVAMSEKEVIPFVGRRIQHHEFTATTDMSFKPTKANQNAGLAVLKDETHQYHLVKARVGKSDCIQLRKITDGGSEVMASVKAPKAKWLKLKVEGNGKTFAFSYSADGGKSWNSVADGVDAAYTSTAVAGGFTGTLVGPFASSILQ